MKCGDRDVGRKKFGEFRFWGIFPSNLGLFFAFLGYFNLNEFFSGWGLKPEQGTPP